SRTYQPTSKRLPTVPSLSNDRLAWCSQNPFALPSRAWRHPDVLGSPARAPEIRAPVLRRPSRSMCLERAMNVALLRSWLRRFPPALLLLAACRLHRAPTLCREQRLFAVASRAHAVRELDALVTAHLTTLNLARLPDLFFLARRSRHSIGM